MKKVLLLGAFAIFASALALNLSTNSAKNELAAENAAALARVDPDNPSMGFSQCVSKPGGQCPVCAYKPFENEVGAGNSFLYFCKNQD